MNNLVFCPITNENDWKECFAIRKKVFVQEQNVPEVLEMDGKDSDALGFLVKDFQNNAIATCRCRKTNTGYKIERFAVLKEYRALGVGDFLLKNVIDELTKHTHRIYLNAQEQVVSYYAKRGFVVCSAAFVEAGIQHYQMEFGDSQTITKSFIT